MILSVLDTEVAGTVKVLGEKLHWRIDAICQDPKTERKFALEHKTTGSWLTNAYASQWQQKFQIACLLLRNDSGL